MTKEPMKTRATLGSLDPFRIRVVYGNSSTIG
jgi:hypothetical protein